MSSRTSDGQYVLCFGQSMRDFDTFFDAVERLPYAAAITRPDLARLRLHGSRFSRSLDQLPEECPFVRARSTRATIRRSMYL